MKHLLSLFTATVICLTTMAANTESKHLTAVFSYATFYHPTVGSYVESYLSFDAWNLNFVKSGAKYQATVEILITISKDDSIEAVKKYELASPKSDTPNPDKFNFLDVQRFAIPNGIHQMRITLHDKNSSDEATVVDQQIAVLYTPRTTTLSSVQMMSTLKPTTTENILSRSGYDMEPYVNDFLPEQIGQIHYYYEVYNINRETKDTYVYAFSFIETSETGTLIENTQTAQRLERDTIIPVLGTIDISNLPSGNYNLVVEIRNRHNDLMLYKRVPFVRSNPGLTERLSNTPVSMTFAGELNNEEQLNEYIEALAPIANEQERRDIYKLIHVPGLSDKQTFLYQFWTRREGLNAESAWLNYRSRIEYVNANFSWPKNKGIHTDRGRVYLQYGPPDYVRDEKNYVYSSLGSGVNVMNDASSGIQAPNSPSTESKGQIFYLPYQLWRYNELPGDEPNRCFIFWDEFRSGFYKLLNSNARGEVREADWERRLCQQQLNEGIVGAVGEQFERGY